MVPFMSLISIPKHVVGITRHVVTTISAFSFTMPLLDRILTHIVNHISNTSYHLQYLYCQVGYVFGAKPNLITCVGYIFLSVITTCPLSLSTRNLPPPSPANSCVFYIILPSEVKFYPQAGSPQNQFCRCWDRLFRISADTESISFL